VVEKEARRSVDDEARIPDRASPVSPRPDNALGIVPETEGDGESLRTFEARDRSDK